MHLWASDPYTSTCLICRHHPLPAYPPSIAPNPCSAASTYMANLEILAHEEVEGGAGMCANGADAAAAVPQEPQAEVGTQLRVLLEQQLRELPPGPRQAPVSPSVCQIRRSPVRTWAGAPVCSAFVGHAQQTLESNWSQALAVTQGE